MVAVRCDQRVDGVVVPYASIRRYRQNQAPGLLSRFHLGVGQAFLQLRVPRYGMGDGGIRLSGGINTGSVSSYQMACQLIVARYCIGIKDVADVLSIVSCRSGLAGLEFNGRLICQECHTELPRIVDTVQEADYQSGHIGIFGVDADRIEVVLLDLGQSVGVISVRYGHSRSAGHRGLGDVRQNAGRCADFQSEVLGRFQCCSKRRHLIISCREGNLLELRLIQIDDALLLHAVCQLVADGYGEIRRARSLGLEGCLAGNRRKLQGCRRTAGSDTAGHDCGSAAVDCLTDGVGCAARAVSLLIAFCAGQLYYLAQRAHVCLEKDRHNAVDRARLNGVAVFLDIEVCAGTDFCFTNRKVSSHCYLTSLFMNASIRAFASDTEIGVFTFRSAAPVTSLGTLKTSFDAALSSSTE